MNIVIHRGSHQIGGSCIELSTERTRIILDIGEELPSLDETALKILSLRPKVKGLYKGDVKSVNAILISHGHGDHVGLIKEINPEIPVYIGENALKIINVTAQFTGGNPISNPVNYLVSAQPLTIGDFEITPYLVDHSGFDAYAFVIKTEGQCVVYTGDFRDHGKKKKATDYFRQHLPTEIDALLIEGTMMSRRGEILETEDQIEAKAYDFMQSKSAPVLVLQSSTNIDRLVGMYRAAKRSGRIFAMDIFTANIVSNLDDSIPKPGQFEDVRVFYPWYLTNKMFEHEEGKKLMNKFSRYKITKEELGKSKKYCMMIRSSMLSDLRLINNLNGAGLIYSMWSGYKKQNKMNAILEYAKSSNMEVIDLHTSGHASLETMGKLISSCKPQKIIPIHTENPVGFCDRFGNIYLAKDGETINL